MKLLMISIMFLCGHIADDEDPIEEEPQEEVGDTSEYPSRYNPWDWQEISYEEPLDRLDKRS